MMFSDRLSDPHAPNITSFFGVNDSNIVAGSYFSLVSFEPFAFTYDIGSETFTPIVLPPSFNAKGVVTSCVNNAGDIVGSYSPSSGAATQLGFLDIGGTFYSLDDPNSNGFTVPLGINNNGEIVGAYQGAAGPIHGFIYNLSSNTWQTIDDPDASSTGSTTISGINDSGDLVAYSSDGTSTNGFLATKVPEPETWVMIILGFAGLGFAARRRVAVGL
jgi:PEP-CTERM motif